MGAILQCGVCGNFKNATSREINYYKQTHSNYVCQQCATRGWRLTEDKQGVIRDESDKGKSMRRDDG